MQAGFARGSIATRAGPCEVCGALGSIFFSSPAKLIAATAKHVRAELPQGCELVLAGEGSNAVLAAYAALLSPEVSGLVLANPPATHMDSAAPVLLNVLRVCDIPEVLGMLAPRPLKLMDSRRGLFESTAAAYRAAGVPENLTNVL